MECLEQSNINELNKPRNYRHGVHKEAKALLNDLNLPNPSHYVRKDSSILFLEQYFTTLKQLLDLYRKECRQSGAEALVRYEET